MKNSDPAIRDPLADPEAMHSVRALKPKLRGIVLVVAVLALAGIMLVGRYAAMDVDRDVREWQDRLNIIAEGRKEAVSGWVNEHFSALAKLAENPSLRLYFAEISAMPEGEGGTGEARARADEPSQKTYLRHLLTFTADRQGFSPAAPLSAQIPAEIPYAAVSGIAILDAEGRMVAATPYLTALPPLVQARLREIPANQQALIDFYHNGAEGVGGGVSVGFVVPVYGIQDDPAEAAPIARVVALKNVDEGFFRLLAQPGASPKTLESSLIRQDSGNLVYLTPLADGSGPMEKLQQVDISSQAAAYALFNPGAFTDSRQDYQGRTVLATGRAIAQTPWTLLVKIDRAEALAKSKLRRDTMVAVLTLVLVAVVSLVVAVWYFASSRRALFATRFFRSMAERYSSQGRLLKLVTDNQQDALYILDKNDHYRFVNPTAASAVGMRPAAMIGKPLGDVLGAARAREILEGAQDARNFERTQKRMRRHTENGVEKVFKYKFIPLEQIPTPDTPQRMPGVLVVEQDVSELVQEREHRVRMHRQLVDTLVTLVDRRDPNAASHSRLVASLSEVIARAMSLPPDECERVRLAGNLMNIGKIVVPEEVLTRRDALNEDELRSIRDSLKESAELLRHVDFDGPVVEALQQAQEHWDGSGPQGLAGEDILISARIVAVANAFIGMVSPRSYRPAMVVEAALSMLLEAADKHYDRRVVLALANYMENQGGREMLATTQASVNTGADSEAGASPAAPQEAKPHRGSAQIISGSWSSGV